MDINCPKCAEPTDNDELHEAVAAGDFANYKEALHAFQSQGCEALRFTCNPETLGSFEAVVADAMYDLLGDDADGASAMMEDFRYMGML